MDPFSFDSDENQADEPSLPSLSDAQALAESRIPENTLVSTKMAIKRFTEYLTHAFRQPLDRPFKPNFLEMSPDILSDHLAKFWVCKLTFHVDRSSFTISYRFGLSLSIPKRARNWIHELCATITTQLFVTSMI